MATTNLDKLFYQQHQNDLVALFKKVSSSGLSIAGPQTKLLIDAIKHLFECQYAIPVESSAVGYPLILSALNIVSGDEVIISGDEPAYLIAAIQQAGATPVIADVQADTLNIDIHCVDKMITAKTKAIVCNHHHGLACDLDSFLAQSYERSIPIIEHNGTTVGATYKAFKAGTLGNITLTSFEPGNLISALGNGAIITTNQLEYANRIVELKKQFQAFHIQELQAGIIHYKLGILNEIHQSYISVEQQYFKAFHNLDVILPKHFANIQHVYCHYLIKPKFDRDLSALHEKPGIQIAQTPHGEFLSLAIGPYLHQEDISQIISTIIDFFKPDEAD